MTCQSPESKDSAVVMEGALGIAQRISDEAVLVPRKPITTQPDTEHRLGLHPRCTCTSLFPAQLTRHSRLGSDADLPTLAL